MNTATFNKTLFAIALGAAVAAPTAFAESLTPAQIAEERANLHADGSLPFVYSPVLYDSGSNDTVVWSEERIAEFENLHADGSLPFIHSPDAFGSDVPDTGVVWTDEYLADFHNLRSDGSLL